MRVEAAPAPRLVGAFRTNQYAIADGDEPLRMVGRVAAHHADRQRLGDVFGDRQQLRHRLEGLPEIILVEAGDDDALALVGDRIDHHGQLGVEELPFVDAYDLGVGLDELEQLARAFHRDRRNPHVAVRDDVVTVVAGVDPRLENLDLLPRDLGAAEAADQLLALAAEHAADDDFDPALIVWMANNVHVWPQRPSYARDRYSPVSV